MKINEIIHPAFTSECGDWAKYRSVYCGGKEFVYNYLKTFSTRENHEDFCKRREITYAPSFAKSAINEIKNVIFNRLRDVSRTSDSETYKQCIKGLMKGVDNGGATMDYFIGQYVIPELLTMRKVGVYVDMPSNVPQTLIGTNKVHPYLYLYKAEAIKSWRYTDASHDKEFQSVLLFEDQLEYDADCNLPTSKIERYRHIYLNNSGTVSVDFYNKDNSKINMQGQLEETTYTLDIPEIPFVVFEISDSLLKDVADYQIALLNMESADIMYAITSNFPLYIEEFTDTLNSVDKIPTYNQEEMDAADGVNPTEAMISKAKDQEAKIGPTYGRQFPKGTTIPPSFIHPSPEPLQAAMDKEKQIKKDIKLLINLAVNDLSDKMVSADSKKQDESGKQNGLTCIAYVLETCERKIANYWGAYESQNETGVLVNYPKDYDLKSDEERLKEAGILWEMVQRVPSNIFKREILKRITTILLNDKIPAEQLIKIHSEIDNAQGLLSDIDTLAACIEAGTCDKDTASLLLGFAKGVAEKAKTEHEAELAKIAASQAPVGGAARGVKATQTNQPSSSAEKKGKPKRGSAK